MVCGPADYARWAVHRGRIARWGDEALSRAFGLENEVKKPLAQGGDAKAKPQDTEPGHHRVLLDQPRDAGSHGKWRVVVEEQLSRSLYGICILAWLDVRQRIVHQAQPVPRWQSLYVLKPLVDGNFRLAFRGSVHRQSG